MMYKGAMMYKGKVTQCNKTKKKVESSVWVNFIKPNSKFRHTKHPDGVGYVDCDSFLFHSEGTIDMLNFSHSWHFQPTMDDTATASKMSDVAESNIQILGWKVLQILSPIAFRWNTRRFPKNIMASISRHCRFSNFIQSSPQASGPPAQSSTIRL